MGMWEMIYIPLLSCLSQMTKFLSHNQNARKHKLSSSALFSPLVNISAQLDSTQNIHTLMRTDTQRQVWIAEDIKNILVYTLIYTVILM